MQRSLKKLAIIISCIGLFFLNTNGVFAKESAKSLRQKKAIGKWCNVSWFEKEGYFDLYEAGIEIVGIEKIKIGKLKKRWTCHWRPKPDPAPFLGYEHWWTTKNGLKKESYRTLEHHYKSSGEYGDNSYSDVWIMKDPMTKKKQSCQNFHQPEKVYSGNAAVVSEFCHDISQ